MDKDAADPLRDRSNWITPAEAAAEHVRKKSEPKRIWGMVLVSGILSAFLAIAIGSVGAFFLFWFVSAMMLTSFACGQKEGP